MKTICDRYNNQQNEKGNCSDREALLTLRALKKVEKNELTKTVIEGRRNE